MRKNLPDASLFIGKPVPGMEGYTIRGNVGSGGNGLVFRARNDSINRDIACKIIPRSNLAASEDHPDRWKEEVLKANALRNRTVVNFVHVAGWKDEASGIDCVAMCSDYVSGITLESYIKKNKGNVSLDFVERFLLTILDLFNEMKQRSISHGDFHPRNVMVEEPQSLLEPQHTFRVMDFGVAPVTSGRGLLDDYLQLAFMLKELLEQVPYPSESPRNKYAYNVLRDSFLRRYLIETDATREPLARQPRALFEELRQIDVAFNRAQLALANIEMATPFDYLSCEQLGDSHSLLRALYSNRFLGLDEIESRNNLVLTGPRGCGKSTVFKSLSLKHRMVVKDDDPSNVKYVGIYYRCDDLYFAFPRYRIPEREAACDIPLYFLTSTLIAEALEAIETWARSYCEEEFKRLEPQVTDRLRELLRIARPERPGAATFRALTRDLLRQRERATQKQRFVNDQTHPQRDYYGPNTLIEACEILTGNFGFLRDRPIFFFIDDYSSPKITESLQENLNRLLMQRAPCCFFKLSTESPVSFSRADMDGKIYVEGREFNLLNLGVMQIRGESHDAKLEFLEDVFRRRLRTIADYPASELEDLIGIGEAPTFNQIARDIRKGHKPSLWGKVTLGRLCSGDVHYVISLVGRMVDNVGGKEGLARARGKPLIPQVTQNKTIRAAAGDFLRNLRAVPMHGDRLVEIVAAFGNVAHSYLMYRDAKNEEGSPPHQTSRIEPLEGPRLSREAQGIYNELLRYSVFIEDVRGKSRRGKVVPRLWLRRFLVPHFGLTFSLRDPLELEPQEMEELLLRPTEFETKRRLKESSNGKSGTDIDGQMLLGKEYGPEVV